MEEDASGYASASSHSSPSSTTTSSSARTVSNVPEFGEAVRYQPLDLKAMREAAAIGDEQQKTGRETEIRKRAQYYTFTDRRTRGPAYEGDRTYHVLSMESWLKIPYKSEYLNPNPELAHLPERWYASLHEPWTGDDWYPEVPNTGDLADEAFREALNGWDNDQRAQQLKEAIETIENPGAIKKIVCIGLGRLILPSANNDKPEVCAVSLAQHTAAIKIAEQLKQLTGQDSRIYAVDPGYHAEHKRALEKRNITILDNSYEKQEHFPEIDDSTIVIAIPGLSITYLKDLILEYARPAVLIIERSKVHDFPPWKSFQPDVTEDDTRVARAKDFQWWEMFKSPRTSEGFGIRETIAVPGKPVGMESSETMRILEEEYDLVEKFPVCLGQDEPWHLYNKERDQARLVPTWHMDNTDLPPAGHYWSPRVRMYKRKAEYDLPQKDGPKNLV